MQRDYIVIEQSKLLATHENDTYVTQLLSDLLKSRNYFNERDPVSADSDFFARNQLVDGMIGELNLGRCYAVLGLRRIGKTSILKRIERVNASTGKGAFWTLYVNAQRVRTTNGTASDLLLQVCRDLENAWYKKFRSNIVQAGSIPLSMTLLDASTYFHKYIQRFRGKSNRNILLIIDDFQELLPSTSRDSSWNHEYVGFASTLKSTHLEHGSGFVYLLASTNPNFIREEFHDIQNPFLSSIEHEYINLFSRSEIDEMLRELGKPMGVKIGDDALKQIFYFFGGHPFLSRQFCSIMCSEQPRRPIAFGADDVKHTFDRHKGLLDSDFHMMLENLRVIFPSEYRLVVEMARNPQPQNLLNQAPGMFRDNLIGYGIVDSSGRFRMWAMAEYLNRAADAERYVKISDVIAEIEGALRQLIVFNFKLCHGDLARIEIEREIEAVAGHTLAAPVRGADGLARVRDLRLPGLVSIILRRWEEFSATAPSKEILEKAASAFASIYSLTEGETIATITDEVRQELRNLKDALLA